MKHSMNPWQFVIDYLEAIEDILDESLVRFREFRDTHDRMVQGIRQFPWFL